MNSSDVGKKHRSNRKHRAILEAATIVFLRTGYLASPAHIRVACRG
jgi:hypothetical protein